MKKYLLISVTSLLLLAGFSLMVVAKMDAGLPGWLKPAGLVCCLAGFVTTLFAASRLTLTKKQRRPLVLAAVVFVIAACILLGISIFAEAAPPLVSLAGWCCLIIANVLNLVGGLHFWKQQD